MGYVDAVVKAKQIRLEIGEVCGTPLGTSLVQETALPGLEPNTYVVADLISHILLNPSLRATAAALRASEAVSFMDELQAVNIVFYLCL